MSQLVNQRWFALAELIFVITCGIVLYFNPSVGGWIILIALLPMLLRIVAGRFSIGRTDFFVLLVIFLVTVGIGIWSAYDRQAAWDKFWILIGAVVLYYALISQPRANLGIVAGLVGIVGVIIAITFIMTNDWNSQSSDLELINRAGGWIMAVRPSGLNFSLPPNIVGGVLAMIAPVLIALIIESWRKRNSLLIAILLIMGLVLLFGLGLTSSRGAWLALITGILIWLLWRGSIFLSSKFERSPQSVVIVLLVLILIPVIWFAAANQGGVVSLANRLPGLSSGASRMELAANTAKLIQDFPFTGGGLRSFPGLYSQYIMVTPFFLFAYSHNFYLDLILELGWFGALALMLLFLTSAAVLLKQITTNRENSLLSLLSEAVLIGLVVVLLHGFVDDALFGDLGTPLLLLLPGLTILLTNLSQQRSSELDQSTTKENSGIMPVQLRKVLLPGSLILVTVLVSYLFRDSLVSSFYANLGAVIMSRSELKNWPTNKWNDSNIISDFELAEKQFVNSLAFDDDQRTAWHRLGLISMQNRDYNDAEKFLERAYNIDPDHRGVRKSLGYTYVWMGSYDEATRILKDISEAKSEMETYSWWWRERDRQDLAWQAKEMAGMLSELDWNIEQEGDN